VPATDVADVVLRVPGSSGPPRRVSVGKAGERAGLLASAAAVPRLRGIGQEASASDGPDV